MVSCKAGHKDIIEYIHLWTLYVPCIYMAVCMYLYSVCTLPLDSFHVPIQTCILHVCRWHVHIIYIYVCTCMYMSWYIHVYGKYLYVIFLYLYSTVCLYNKSSEGVFCCSSSILGRKPLPKLQHETFCCQLWRQEEAACLAMYTVCQNQIAPGSPSHW